MTEPPFNQTDDRSKGEHSGFGPLLKGTFVGAAIGFAYGVAINLPAFDGRFIWYAYCYADAVRCALIGASIGLVFGFVRDRRARKR